MEDVVIVSSVLAQTVLMSAFVNRRLGRKNRKNRKHSFSRGSEN